MGSEQRQSERPADSIAIVGVGAIGGSLAGDLHAAGRPPLQLCSRRAFDALAVVHPHGVDHAPGAHCDPAQATPADWVLLATKAHQTEAAKPWLDALCRPDTVVAVLQNGIDHVERVAPLVQPASVLPVVVQLPAVCSAPGVVEQSRDGTLLVPDSPSGFRFAKLFATARTTVRVTAHFEATAWLKLMTNLALGGFGALTLEPNGIAQRPEHRGLVDELLQEAAAVAAAAGIQFERDPIAECWRRIDATNPQHWSSITLDRRAGRTLEWEVRHGIVGRLGRRHGLPTPWNDAVTATLRGPRAG